MPKKSKKKIIYAVFAVVLAILFALYHYSKCSLIWLIPAVLFVLALFLLCFGFLLLGMLYFLFLILDIINSIRQHARSAARTPAHSAPKCPDIFSGGRTVLSLKSEKKPWEITKYLLVVVVSLWAMNFCTTIVCSCFAAAEVRLVSSSVRFPLADATAIAVDTRGRVYCWSRLYSRLQVYDKNGQFLRGWFLGTASSCPNMTVDSNDILYVETATNEHVTFDVNGILLGRSNRALREKPSNYQSKDSDGNIYKTHKSWISEILKVSPSGEKSLLVSDPFYLKFVAAIFPTFFMWVPVLFVTGIYKAYKEKKQNKKEPQ